MIVLHLSLLKGEEKRIYGDKTRRGSYPPLWMVTTYSGDFFMYFQGSHDGRRMRCIISLVSDKTRPRVIDFTRYHVKNNTELTNLMKMYRIQGYNGKYGSNSQGI